MKKFTVSLLMLLMCLGGFYAQRNNKVVVCHVPPGNPENAHNIEISVNALAAHIPGNNKHNDFLGDCFTGCDVMEVIAFTQGLQSNGTPVVANRSNVNRIFDIDGVNAEGGFVTLGFGGEIIVKMDGGILNRPGNDLMIFETSFGQPTCDEYPEHAQVWVSADMNDWHLAGEICQDGAVDISPLDWIQYVKIVDISVPGEFSGVVDGFDIDGLRCVPFSSSRQSQPQVSADVIVYPNPAKNVLNVTFQDLSVSQQVEVSILDIAGKRVGGKVISAGEGHSNHQIEIGDLAAGVHVVQIKSDEIFRTEKIAIK